MGTSTFSLQHNSQASTGWEKLISFFREELGDRPGRSRAAFVRVGGAIIAMWIGLALDMPEMGAVMALAFFGSSVNQEESKKISFGVPPTVLLIFLVLTLCLNILGATPLVRTVAFIVIVFGSLYLLQAAREGAVFLLAGVFGKLFLQLWDAGSPTELTQELQFWIIADLALAGLCAVFVSLVFGRPAKDPAVEFRNSLASRFDLLAGVLATPAKPDNRDEEKLRAEARCAADDLLPMLKAAEKKNSDIKAKRRALVELIRVTRLLLHQSVILQADEYARQPEAAETLEWMGRRSAAIAEAIRSDSSYIPRHERPNLEPDPIVLAMVSTLELAENVLAGRVLLPEGQNQDISNGFLRPDALTNSSYFEKAARAFAAAFACYCFVSGTMWSGIGTAVTTCLLTSLTTVEQARQKQSLRIVGAAIGGLIGLIVIVFLLPMGGIVSLSIATAAVTFLGGWIYAGSPKIGYAGVQLVLCYYLGVFGENKTPTSLTSMRDRVIGIFIGNLAMWLIYDGIRPAWNKDSPRGPLADKLVAIEKVLGLRQGAPDNSGVAGAIPAEENAFSAASAQLQEMRNASHFSLRDSRVQASREQSLLGCTEVHLQQLFSFEFVALEIKLLGLPAITATPQQSLSEPLLSLASNVRNGYPIRRMTAWPVSQETALEARLFECVRTDLARFFCST